MARFDPKNWHWSNIGALLKTEHGHFVPPKQQHGIANVMQFGVDPDNQLWFSEWTENKIAKLDASKQVPIAVTTPTEVTVAKGESTGDQSDA